MVYDSVAPPSTPPDIWEIRLDNDSGRANLSVDNCHHNGAYEVEVGDIVYDSVDSTAIWDPLGESIEI